MSVLFVLVWSSRKWPWHFISKHREMTPHSLTTWKHPKPNESSPWLRQIAIARGSWFDTELYLYCSRTSTKLVLCNNDLLVNLFLKFSYMGDNAHKTIALYDTGNSPNNPPLNLRGGLPKTESPPTHLNLVPGNTSVKHSIHPYASRTFRTGFHRPFA